MAEVPTINNGRDKESELGRGIDDFLRSIIPGALPQSTDQISPVMGKQQIQTGIQVPPTPGTMDDAGLNLTGDVPPVAAPVSTPEAANVVPNVASGDPMTEDDNARALSELYPTLDRMQRAATGEQVPFDPDMTKTLLEVIREALASQPATPLQPTTGVNPLGFVGGS